VDEKKLTKGKELHAKISMLKNRVKTLKQGFAYLDSKSPFHLCGTNLGDDTYLSKGAKRSMLIIAIAEHEQALERLEAEFAAL